MSAINSCQSKNVFYNDLGALQITNQLCSCPDVRSLLASLGDQIAITIQTGSYPQIRSGFIEKKQASNEIAESVIQIPAKALKTKETLGHFIFEIFNVKNRGAMESLMNRAKNGDIDINAYAKGIEKIEFQSRDASIDLALKCNYLHQADLKDTTRDLEIHLWNKEFDCHTDKIRERWIENYQKSFCEKHPKAKSCKIKKEDLCDYYQLVNMPEDEKYYFKIDRICSRLSKLPQKVKDWWPTEISYCRLREEL